MREKILSTKLGTVKFAMVPVIKIGPNIKDPITCDAQNVTRSNSKYPCNIILRLILQ